MTTLCVYCTRTGLTKQIVETVAKGVEGDLLCITDGKDRRGVWGYLGAAVEALRKKAPALMPFDTPRPLEEYDRILLGFPIWCEDACILAKSFLTENRERLRGELCYVATHMSDISYENRVEALSTLAGKPAAAVLSVQTRKYDWSGDVAAFIRRLNA